MTADSLCARDLVQALNAAWSRRDWAEIEALHHPDALLTTVAGGGEPLPPAEMIAAVRRASEDAVYTLALTSFSEPDERTCIASGRIRHRLPEGGFADSERHWLFVFKDGLLWRSGVYTTAGKACAALQEQGHTLGVDAQAAATRAGRA